MRDFKRTLYEEVFSRKVGVNPPLILKPEEVPIISEVVDDASKIYHQERLSPLKQKATRSDDEVKPENYFFSNDC